MTLSWTEARSPKVWRHVLHHRLTRHLGRGVRLSRQVWDAEYQAGEWAYMDDTQEAPRYEQLVGLWERYGGGTMLDVGCGDGILWDRLAAHGCAPSTYLGVDISAAAIGQARQRAAHRPVTTADSAAFEAVDYDTESVPGTFQAVVFNETLAYFRRPARIVAKAFADNVAQDGIVVISLWDREAYGDDALWRRVAAGWRVVAESEAGSPEAGLRWRAKVLAR